MSRGADLVGFCVTVKETNLLIRAETDLTDEAYSAVMDARNTIEGYIRSRPEFQTSLIPIADDPYAAPIIKEMIRDSGLSGVGPMAGVAGAIAEFVARRLLPSSGEIIVENGGDVFLVSGDTRVIALCAENEGPNVGIEVGNAKRGLGICSSSAVIGRSLSLGNDGSRNGCGRIWGARGRRGHRAGKPGKENGGHRTGAGRYHCDTGGNRRGGDRRWKDRRRRRREDRRAKRLKTEAEINPGSKAGRDGDVVSESHGRRRAAEARPQRDDNHEGKKAPFHLSSHLIASLNEVVNIYYHNPRQSAIETTAGH